MFLSKKWQIIVGTLTVLFMTIAVTAGLKIRLSKSAYDAASAESSMTAASETQVIVTEPEYTVSEEETNQQAAETEEHGAAVTWAGDSHSDEMSRSMAEDAVAEKKRSLRLCRILLPVSLILALAGLFVFSVFFRRRQAPEGLETNLLILALYAGFLYMLFRQFTPGVQYNRGFTGWVMNEVLKVSAVDILFAAVLSCLLVWGIRTIVSWFLAKRTFQFSLLWRLTERLKTQLNGISLMLLVPFLSALGLLVLSAVFALLARLTWRSVYGISGLMASLSFAFILLFTLTVFLFLDRLRDVRRVQEEMIESARVNERYRVDLITNVSHDLRTPLTSIIGYGELLKAETLSADGRENLEKLNQKSSYLRDMVDAVFELSKVQSGAVSGKREQIDLIRLLEQTIGEYDDAITAAGLSVVRRYRISSAPLISDGIFLNQIFANLLSNAVKYTMKGTRIHVELTEIGEEYQIRMMNVASYEMKFTEEEILQRFARGDESRNTEGNGLGLAIVKTYTEALHGTFRVELDGDLFIAIVKVPKELPE